MRRALTRAARRLLAAGALGLLTPAAADAAPPAAAAGGDADEVGARLGEIKVELGWLADPATFPWALSAHAAGGRLEARGRVPTAAAREAALHVARCLGGLPVVDRLTIDPTLPPPGPPAADAAALRERVRATLANAYGEAGRACDVQVGPRGVATVQGAVGSLEARLLVSRRLRGVEGLACVDNRLTVIAQQRGDRFVTPVSVDGRLAHPGPVRLDQNGPEAPLVTVAAAEKAPDAPTALATPALPPGWPAPRPVASAGGAGPGQAPEAPPQVKQMPQAPQPLPALPVARSEPLLPTGGVGGSFAGDRAGMRAVERQAGLSGFASQKVGSPAPPVSQAGPTDFAIAAPPRPSAARAELPRPAPTPAPASGNEPRQWPAAFDETAAQTQPAEGTISFDEGPPRPAVSAAPAPTKEPAPVVTSVPLVETLPAAPRSAPPVASARLKQQVQAACGRLAQQVEVTADADGGRTVRVVVAEPGLEAAVTERVRRLPEMTPQVRLEVVVGR
jgi:hypothetical protein